MQFMCVVCRAVRTFEAPLLIRQLCSTVHKLSSCKHFIMKRETMCRICCRRTLTASAQLRPPQPHMLVASKLSTDMAQWQAVRRLTCPGVQEQIKLGTPSRNISRSGKQASGLLCPKASVIALRCVNMYLAEFTQDIGQADCAHHYSPSSHSCVVLDSHAYDALLQAYGALTQACKRRVKLTPLSRVFHSGSALWRRAVASRAFRVRLS